MSVSYSKLVSDMRSAFNSGRTRPIEWRKEQLRGLKKMFEENAELFCKSIHRDLRKHKVESFLTEVDYLINDMESCLRDVDDWVKPLHPQKTVPSIFDKLTIHPEPYGIALIMGSWNYPLHLTLAPLGGAIAAGNCAVIKPSEVSENTARAIAELLPKYVDPECFKVVTGGVAETTELLKEKFDYIFFTGSTNVGRIVGAAANKHLTPTTLELGGKSPVFVEDGVNVEVAAKRIIWGKAVNVGQTCVAPDYILCSKETEGQLVKWMKQHLREWYGDKPQQSDSMSRIISERHFDRLHKLLQTSKGKVVIGGHHDRSDKYIDVTVLTDVSPSDSTMQEEIFGPILPIVNVSGVKEAIDFINAREKPLALYVFSENRGTQETFIERTSSGGLNFNEILLQIGVETLPFGGVGSSGMGAYHGKASFDTFTHYKSTLTRDLGWLTEKVGSVRYPPFNEKNIPYLQQLLKNRKLPNLGYVGTFLIGAVATVGGILAGVGPVIKEFFT